MERVKNVLETIEPPQGRFDHFMSPKGVLVIIDYAHTPDAIEAALDALRRGQLDALRLLAPGDPGAAELHISRRDLWKFWRKPRALAELAPP